MWTEVPGTGTEVPWTHSYLANTPHQHATFHRQPTVCEQHYCHSAWCRNVHNKEGLWWGLIPTGNTEATISSPLGWETAADRTRRSSIDLSCKRALTLVFLKVCVRFCLLVCVLWLDLSHECQCCYVNQWLALDLGVSCLNVYRCVENNQLNAAPYNQLFVFL